MWRVAKVSLKASCGRAGQREESKGFKGFKGFKGGLSLSLALISDVVP
jgi:hypothetical protein